MDKKNKTLFSKVKGVVLLEAFLALLLMAMASYGLATVNSVQFSQMAAGKDADLARNYAELEAEYIKSLGFDAVVTDNKDEDEPSRTPRYPEGAQSSVDKAANARDMTKFLGETLGSEWRSTATLGKTISNINGDSDNMIQNVVVSVYKASDGDNASPRATITVPLSSSSSQSKASLELDYDRKEDISNKCPYTVEKSGFVIANLWVWRNYNRGVYINGVLFASAMQPSDSYDAYSSSGSVIVSKGDVISSTMPTNKASIIFIPFK